MMRHPNKSLTFEEGWHSMSEESETFELDRMPLSRALLLVHPIARGKKNF